MFLYAPCARNHRARCRTARCRLTSSTALTTSVEPSATATNPLTSAMPSSSVPSLAYSDFSPPSTSVSLLQTPRTQADLLPDYPFDTIRTPAYRIPSDTPGQRGDRIWVRPIFCRGGWILRDRLSSGYTDLVCAARLDSAGWMTLGPVMVWEGEGVHRRWPGRSEGPEHTQRRHRLDLGLRVLDGGLRRSQGQPRRDRVR